MKVRYVTSRTLKDYAGMNHWAAKELHFKPVPKKGEILVDKHMTPKDRADTIRHEKHEARLMKNGMHYFCAHKHALKAEKKH